MAKGRENIVGKIGISHAIWPGNLHAGAASECDQFILLFLAINLIGFSITRCVGHSGRNSEGVAALKHWQGCVSGDRDDGKIDDLWYRLDVLICCQALYGLILRIDWIDFGKACAFENIYRNAADTPLVIRRSDDRN